jgi:hypothetical protein
MLIILLDTTTGSATSIAPTYHILDTAGGSVQFVSGGSTSPGTISFNGTTIFTPATIAVWGYLQGQITNAILQGVQTLSFVNLAGPTVTSATGVLAAGGVTSVVGTGFQPQCSGMLDVAAGSALSIMNLGYATYTDDQHVAFTVPAVTAGTYKLTIFNPDGGYVVFVTGVVVT